MTETLDRALGSARAFVRDSHPNAAASALAGSVAAGRGTTTSDLDIVVYYDSSPASFAETHRYDGWLIETFVYGPEGIDEWFGREAGERRPVALDMWSTGIPLTGSAAAARLQAHAKAIMAAGPAPINPDEHADLRYALTAAIDDLAGGPEPGEDFAVTADVYKRAGELLLLDNRRWLGTGKWLVRRLAQFHDPLAEGLVNWARSRDRSPDELLRIARAVLESAGGSLQDGHVRGSRR